MTKPSSGRDVTDRFGETDQQCFRSRFQIEERTWQALVAYRSKILTRELGGKGKELDTAEDYLVR